MQTNEIEIVYYPIEDIRPAKYNPREIDEIELAGLAESIDKFGFVDPLIVNIRDGKNILVGGHQRLKVAKIKRMTKVPVVEVDLNPIEEKALNISLNNKHIQGKFQKDLLGELLLDLKKQEKDLFEKLNFEPLLEEYEIEEVNIELLEPQSDEDEVPSIIEDPKSKRGDIFILGNHRLMCGDSTMIDDVEKLMNGQKADMVFTDPPYGVSYQSNMRVKSDKFDIIENDNKFITEWINILPIVSKGWVFIWTTWKVIRQWLEITLPLGEPSNLIIWDKGGGGIGDLYKTFSTDYEMAIVFNRQAKITGKRLGSIWPISKDAASTYMHPTQKPVELAETSLLNCTYEKNSVLDLFGGSGSTLIACEKTNRKCFMMELDPRYIDTIINRWQNYTGKKAYLLKQNNEQIAFDDL